MREGLGLYSGLHKNAVFILPSILKLPIGRNDGSFKSILNLLLTHYINISPLFCAKVMYHPKLTKLLYP